MFAIGGILGINKTIIDMVKKGLGYRDIAQELDISLNTVLGHVKNYMKAGYEREAILLVILSFDYPI
ncbi:MAG: IS1-like element transposase [Sodalis sp. (in: enterobacteria)]